MSQQNQLLVKKKESVVHSLLQKQRKANFNADTLSLTLSYNIHKLIVTEQSKIITLANDKGHKYFNEPIKTRPCS